jgi:hypothetical protein
MKAGLASLALFTIQSQVLKKEAAGSLRSFFFLFIYSHVHTLFGPFLPPCPLPPLCPPTPSRFQAEPVLPFSPVLLKRRHKQ